MRNPVASQTGPLPITAEPVIDRFLDDVEVSGITGRARSTLQKDRVFGNGIPFVRIGRLVRYRESVVRRWLAELPMYKSTTEADIAEACRGIGDGF